MSELDRYLSTARIKDVKDPLFWWYENRGTYPRLWRMARDYLTIPGKYSLFYSLPYRRKMLASSVAVERVFSKGRLLMSHIRNRLSGDSTRALLCLGAWTKSGFVETLDLKHAASLPDAKDDDQWPEDEFMVV